jgi:2-isopropylmalate synthase
VRVLTSHSNVDSTWDCVGVHQNIIDASWTAVAEGLIVGLLRAQERPATTGWTN